MIASCTSTVRQKATDQRVDAFVLILSDGEPSEYAREQSLGSLLGVAIARSVVGYSYSSVATASSTRLFITLCSSGDPTSSCAIVPASSAVVSSSGCKHYSAGSVLLGVVCSALPTPLGGIGICIGSSASTCCGTAGPIAILVLTALLLVPVAVDDDGVAATFGKACGVWLPDENGSVRVVENCELRCVVAQSYRRLPLRCRPTVVADIGRSCLSGMAAAPTSEVAPIASRADESNLTMLYVVD